MLHIKKIYLYNCIIDNELKTIKVGRKIHDFLTKNQSICDINNDTHLSVIKDEIPTIGYSVFGYDNSFYTEIKNWLPINVNNSKDLYDYIIKNQYYFYEENKHLFSKNNLLSIIEFLSEERDKKINKLFNRDKTF